MEMGLWKVVPACRYVLIKQIEALYPPHSLKLTLPTPSEVYNAPPTPLCDSKGHGAPFYN